MALFLVVLFVLVPLAELAVIIAAAGSFGLGATLAALLLFSVAGGWLMRREGLAVWRRANAELARGRPPANELLDGAMILGGGALLLTPGFITDFVGLVLLLAPVRALVRPLLMRAMAGRANVATPAARFGAARTRGASFGGFDPFVVDADVVDPDVRGADRPAASATVIRVEPLDPEQGPGELDPGS